MISTTDKVGNGYEKMKLRDGLFCFIGEPWPINQNFNGIHIPLIHIRISGF